MRRNNNVWCFNRNYRDHNQVAPFTEAYMARYDELTAAGKYPYNDSFRGHIPGIEGPDEDTAIYLLQGARHFFDWQTSVDEAMADGCAWFDTAPAEGTFVRFSRVIHVGFEMGGTGWREWNDARIVSVGEGRAVTLAVLPKGKRTKGHILCGGKVLVKGGHTT